MKILHTADWHIGKLLYGYHLNAEIQLFLDWLLNYIQEEEVDVLLVAGDIFDLSNPSNVDRTIYYSFLAKLIKLSCHVVITAGNHDSPNLIDAPTELLKYNQIYTIGHGDDLSRQIIPIEINGQGVVILAAPYLREGDVRKAIAGERYDDKKDATRAGIVNHYQQLAQLAKTQYPNIPLIAMGHLFMDKSVISDSERLIQVGNLAGISVTAFEHLFDYMALGHIHKPQSLDKNKKIRFSGSPISLSFSERTQKKRMIQVEIQDKLVQSHSIPIPTFRSLIRIEGTFEAVQIQLKSIRNNNELPVLVEIVVQEKQWNSLIIQNVLQVVEEGSPNYIVANYRIFFEQGVQGLEGQSLSTTIQDLDVRDVFEKRLEQDDAPEETKKAMRDAFEEVCAQIEL